MRLSFDTKHFDKGNKENATASLGAFVPGTQADHLFHRRDESFGHDQDFPISSTKGLVSNAIDYNPRRPLGIPENFNDDDIVVNSYARPSFLATAFAAEGLASNAVGINAKARRDMSSGEEITTSPVVLSLPAFVPGTQADHFVYGKDASFGHEQDFVFMCKEVASTTSLLAFDPAGTHAEHLLHDAGRDASFRHLSGPQGENSRATHGYCRFKRVSTSIVSARTVSPCSRKRSTVYHALYRLFFCLATASLLMSSLPCTAADLLDHDYSILGEGYDVVELPVLRESLNGLLGNLREVSVDNSGGMKSLEVNLENLALSFAASAGGEGYFGRLGRESPLQPWHHNRVA